MSDGSCPKRSVQVRLGSGINKFDMFSKIKILIKSVSTKKYIFLNKKENLILLKILISIDVQLDSMLI
jgi:hypothetical protein